MCVVSNIGDGWSRTVPGSYPWVNPAPTYPVYNTPPTREEFDALVLEMQELKKLLLAGKDFDEATGQPDCHTDDKVALIRKLAEYVGVDVSDIFGE